MRYLLILSKHAWLTILKFFPTLIALLLHPARLTLPLNFSTLLANSFYKFENFADKKIIFRKFPICLLIYFEKKFCPAHLIDT